MKLLWKYLLPSRTLIYLALLFAGLAQTLALIDPIIFGQIIDRFTQQDQNYTVSDITRWLLLALGIAILSRLFKALQDYFMRKAVASFGMNIFNDGLKQTLRLSYQEFEEGRSGTTLSVLQKVKTDSERFINATINVLFSSLVGITFLIWYSLSRNWLLVPVFFVGVLLLGSLTGLVSKRIKFIQRSINRQTDKQAGVITESLRNIELVKSFGLTFPEIRRLNELTSKIFRLEMAKARKVSSLSFLQGALLAMLKQSILFILLWLIFRDILSTGELIAMQFISVAIFTPLQELGNLIILYREANASLVTFDRMMHKPVEQIPKNAIEVPALSSLSFKEVVFRHRTASYNAIDGLSFAISSGETIAFVGPSGAGKSTLVKLLVGLYRPKQGHIYYNDISSDRVRYNPLRRQIGFVTQDTQLYAGTIKHNLLFANPAATDAEIDEAIHQAAADGMIAKAENGIDTLLGESGMKLSGGEKQRISIARALLRKPNLLIFDEATSALDSLTEEEITSTIRKISASGKQMTILIAHRLSIIMHADRIYVLEKGCISEMGAHEELLLQKGLYYAMWRQQAGERR